MYRWVPWDAWTRYGRDLKSTLRMVDEWRRWVSCGWRFEERRYVGIAVGLSNGDGLWLRLPPFEKDCEKAVEIKGRRV